MVALSSALRVGVQVYSIDHGYMEEMEWPDIYICMPTATAAKYTWLDHGEVLWAPSLIILLSVFYCL